MSANCFKFFLYSFTAQEGAQKERVRDVRQPLQEAQYTLATLQDKLIVAPLLALPCTKGHSSHEMDLRDKQVCCVLMLEQLEGKRPLIYSPNMLSVAEKNYDKTQRKCLEVV